MKAEIGDKELTAFDAALDGVLVFDTYAVSPKRRNDVHRRSSVFGTGLVSLTGLAPNLSGQNLFRVCRAIDLFHGVAQAWYQ